MRFACLVLALTALMTLPARSQSPVTAPAPLSPRNANYDIDVTLDPAARMLTGTETITWTNSSGIIPAYSLRLHAYWNAFRSNSSTWMRQRRLIGDTPFDEIPADDFGYIAIGDLHLLAADGSVAQDLKPGFRYIQPYDGNPDDKSLAVIALKDAVPPGQTIKLRITWKGRFPRNFDRTGQIDHYFFASQWFPKLGVFADDTWTAPQFFANTEFFSDFGLYDVRMTVPAGWKLGATGTQQSVKDNGNGTATHRYTEADVHDFAWTTSPDFEEHTEQFQQPGLPPVTMRLLSQPEHAGLVARHFAGAAAALRYYGEWYGPYPYGHLTIVDPPYNSESGGMEYPTLVTAGTRWLSPIQSNDPEYVVVHEVGHQFFYGIVATDETSHAWMDEGMNEYSDSHVQSVALQPNYLVQRFFGGLVPWQYRDIPLQRATDTNWMNAYRRYADRDAPMNPSYLYYPQSNQAQTYHKTALWMHTLERKVGWDVMQKIMSTYFERWKFKHPKPEDFFAVVNEVTRQDFTWFFDAVYRSSNTFDYAIERFESKPVKTRGLTDQPDGSVKFEDTSVEGVFRTVVVARRLGVAQFPVDVLVTFENGEQAREKWDGLARWQNFSFDRKSKAVSVQIDPERVLLLDTEYTNNSRTMKPQGEAAATKWSLRWMVWLQDLLMDAAFFI